MKRTRTPDRSGVYAVSELRLELDRYLRGASEAELRELMAQGVLVELAEAADPPTGTDDR